MMTDFGWKILIAVVAVIAIVALFLSIVYCRDWWQSYVMDSINW